MNNSYFQTGIYIKDIQKLSKSIKPFFDNSNLKDPFINSLTSTIRTFSSLSDNPRVHPGLKDEQRFMKQQYIISKLENDTSFNLRDYAIDKKWLYHQMQNMQTILNTTGQDPLNGILSDVDISKEVVPEILSSLDISAVNNCVQDIYNNADEFLDTDFEETTLNLLENFKIGIKEYNLNTNITTKIKIPDNMKKWCCLFLVFIFAVLMIVSLSPYLDPEITNYLKAVVQGYAGSALYDVAKEPFKKTDSTK